MRGDPTILHRDDLLVREWGDFDYGAGVHQRAHRTAQDADLRALGYVRLDGVDVEALAGIIHNQSPKCYENMFDEDGGCRCVHKVRGILAAMEGRTP